MSFTNVINLSLSFGVCDQANSDHSDELAIATQALP